MSRRSRPCSGDPEGCRGAAGFTLVELLVATVVLAVAMLIASQILIDAQRLALEARYRLNRPDSELGLALLRRDLRNARRAGSGRLALDGRLELRGGGELGRGRVVYRHSGENLERLAFDADGQLIERAVTLRGVTAFRWRLLNQRLVELHLATTESRGNVASSEVAIVRVALRNSPSTQW